MSPLSGGRNPDAGQSLCLPPAPRVLVTAGRFAGWALHGVLLLWVVAHAVDAWEQRTAWAQVLMAFGLAALMLVLWWRQSPVFVVGWLDRPRHLASAPSPAPAPTPVRAPAARRRPADATARVSHWIDLEPMAPAHRRVSNLHARDIQLRVLLDTGGGMLVLLQEGPASVVTWLPAAALTSVLRWQLRGAGPGSTRR